MGVSWRQTLLEKSKLFIIGPRRLPFVAPARVHGVLGTHAEVGVTPLLLDIFACLAATLSKRYPSKRFCSRRIVYAFWSMKLAVTSLVKQAQRWRRQRSKG